MGSAHEPVVGSVLTYAASGELVWLPSAEVRFERGRIKAVEPVDATSESPPQWLLLPGFVDLHCHWPQSHVRGQFAGALLPWLQHHIWPAEAAFVDPQTARTHAEKFVHDVLRAGTTAGLFFGPPFVEATETFLEHAPVGFFDGPALMERHCPESLQTPVGAMLQAMDRVAPASAERMAVTPRFAPNVDMDGLRAAAEFARARGLLIQSHLSENLDEVRWVAELFPSRRDYTDVYDHAGLLGDRSVMAHGIHLSDRELRRLAETETMIAHCPTSNEALGSGRMPLERLTEAGVQWALATDVGAGPQLSQLHTMATFLRQHRDAGLNPSALQALDHATRVPGQWLARQHPSLTGLGTLTAGAPGHMVAVPHPGGHSANEVLERLLQAAGPRYETAAVQVWLWGDRAP